VTAHPGASLGVLLRRCARPQGPWIALLVGLTLLANGLLVLQPIVLAAILSAILGTAGAAGASGPLFDLNSVGARFLAWLGPAGGDGLTLLLTLGLLYVAQSALASTVDYAAYLTALRVKIGATRRLQTDLLRHLLDLDLRFFHREKSGELMSRVTQDAVNTAVGVGPLVRSLLHHTIQLVAYSLYLVSTSTWLTVGALVLVVLHFVLAQGLKWPIRTLTREVFDRQADLSTALQESLTGIRATKSFGAEGFERGRLDRALDALARVTWRHGRVEKLEAPARAVLDAVGVVGIFMIAAGQLSAGLLTAQGLLLYVYVGRLVMAPANHMATNYLWIQALLASYERISQLFAEVPRVRDGRLAKDRFERAIELRDVSFSYDGRRAVDGVSLELRRGEMVALVGPSGAGKSTLADLVLRLYDPDQGVILMDGVDIRELRQADYRRLFGVVSQENLLFHDTVESNIRFGRRDVTADAVRRAAKFANADGFVRALPEGYDTAVGDRGVRLSGGERQRIAIARAVAHAPAILILDEATSALDSEAERQVQEALDRIVQETTTLVIAHRLSTVLRADKIVVIDAGRVVDVGRHGELVMRCPLYRRLCALQFGIETEAGTAVVEGEGAR
jgi:ABC-type multidrug transport system fused ATPase/permease subunit